MALREFTDGTGSHWRVWDIRPEQMHRAVRAEDHLQAVIDGWLAFESDGGEKRRLSPIPSRWEMASEKELERLLGRAEPVRSGGADVARGQADASADVSSSAHAGGATIRTFRYPGGRYWTVNEQPADTTGTKREHALLVFTSGARMLETRNRPAEWARMSDAELADLLYRSFPRSPSDANPTAFRRRRGDFA